MTVHQRDWEEGRRKKAALNALRCKLFRLWGGSDFARLFEESPAMYRIGFGVFGLNHYEISDDLFAEAERDCKAMISEARGYGRAAA